MHCTFVMPIAKERNWRSVIVFSNVFENFDSRNNALCDLSKVFQLRSRRFPKPRISTAFRRAQKNNSKISRKSTENRMTKKEWAFNKRSEVCKTYRFSVEGYQKNGILSSTNSTVFRRCPKEYARGFINQFMKVGGIKIWKEHTIGVQQLIRLLFNNNVANPGLSFKITELHRKNDNPGSKSS